MINFIRRYKLDRQEIRSLPRHLSQVNDLLKSEYLGNPYHISKGLKRGTYLVVDNYNLDEFGQVTTYTCSRLSSACSTVFRLIKKQFPEYYNINFSAYNYLLKKFPKKYQNSINELLIRLFEVDPLFDVNCDLKLINEINKTCFNDGIDEDALFYIIHDGGTIYDQLSYSSFQQSDESYLIKYLRSTQFDFEAKTNCLTKLFID